MIVVSVSENGITIKGHAGYAEKGKDIVCAAVSALALNMVCSMEALTGDSPKYQIKEGYMDIRYRNLSEQGKLLVDSFFIGICKIQSAYGKEYVRIR